MAQKLNPFSGRQFLDANGDPYSGAQLFVYSAGSSTKVTTTKDSAGVSNHANPIVLNSRGEPADGSGASQAIWQAESQSVKLVLAPSTDTDPPVAAISTWDNIDGVNDTTTTVDQWVSGATPTFVDATSFTLVGDQSSDFHVGRRLKTTNSGGTIYSTITAVAYTSLTTVTVINDSGSLDSGLSAVSYGVVSSDNSSLPAVIQYTLKLSKGADIASTAALTIPNDGNYFDITGTTTITSINTLSGGAAHIKLHFDGILTLTHHATDLILPGAVNITTAAGDEAEFVEYATGDWRCVNYIRASGYPIVNENPLTSGTVTDTSTGETSYELDGSIPSWVKKITIGFAGVSLSGTDEILVQIGDSDGYETTGYTSASSILANGNTVSTLTSTSGYLIPNNNASRAFTGHVVLTSMGSNLWSCSSGGMLTNTTTVVGGGSKTLTGTLDSLRIIASGSNTFDAGSANYLYE